MQNYARIIGGVAVDVSTDPHNSFVPHLADEFVPVPDYVCPQWRIVGMGWAAPQVIDAAPDPVEQAPASRLDALLETLVQKDVLTKDEAAQL